ncbi:MAG: hypothetical protein OJI67_07835 [Prosthecobacter sp.]|nr:hypothetical protein [Prosthecobacter sp.]
MRYIIALIWPPLAAVVSGKTWEGVLNAALWFVALIIIAIAPPLAFLLWLASLIHALVIVSVFYRTRRQQELMMIMKAAHEGTAAALQATAPKPAKVPEEDRPQVVYKI